MIVSISYGNEAFKKSLKYNRVSASAVGKVDKVYSFGPEDVDREFYNANSEILSESRGNGLWLWKPYLIQKTLATLNDNDYLIYTDSSMVYYRPVKGLIEKLEKSGQEMMMFDLPLLEVQWTKKKVFDALDIQSDEAKYSNQRTGAVIILKKTPATVKLIGEWLNLCRNKALLGIDYNDNQNDALYVYHREDQSILSLLTKKYGINSFSDPTDYGKFPMQYVFYNCLFLQKEYDEKYNTGRVYFIHHRGYNLIKYFSKFLLKSMFIKLVYRPRSIAK